VVPATLVQLGAAVVLVPTAGLFAAADAALGSVSRARVEELVREHRTGSRALAAVVADRPRYVNLLLLLRLACETAATVPPTVVALALVRPVWVAVLAAAVVMVVVSYVLVGVGPRTVGRQHPYGVGLWAAAPVRTLARLLGPLTRLLILVGNAITPGRGFREGRESIRPASVGLGAERTFIWGRTAGQPLATRIDHKLPVLRSRRLCVAYVGGRHV